MARKDEPTPKGAKAGWSLGNMSGPGIVPQVGEAPDVPGSAAAGTATSSTTPAASVGGPAGATAGSPADAAGVVDDVAVPAAAEPGTSGEIGRASCRERVSYSV